jgi:hypothetical protein
MNVTRQKNRISSNYVIMFMLLPIDQMVTGEDINSNVFFIYFMNLKSTKANTS